MIINYNLRSYDFMKLCYVATPYRGPNELVVEQNILNAKKAAVALMQGTDYFPVSPVLNTGGFHHYEKLLGYRGDEYWLKGSLELLNRCDAIYMAPDWYYSGGCIKEIEFVINQMIGIESRDIKIYENENEEHGPIIELTAYEMQDVLNRIDR